MVRGASILLLAGALLLWSRCDTVEPEGEPLLVVEAFVAAGQPLGGIVLRQTRPLSEPYAGDSATAVTDAAVVLHLGGTPVSYRAVPGRPGRYEPAPPAAPPVASPRASFELAVDWQGQHAAAAGTVPPPIEIDSVRVDVPEEPVEAILLDTLAFTDSLGVPVKRGYIYAVEVTLWWTVAFAETGADSLYWVQTQLRPYAAFSSATDNFFLRPAQVLRERTMRQEGGRRSWTGVYAVPVAQAAAPLPPHTLRVALLRSGRAYARFAASRDTPERREPVSNVDGALGIVAGIAVDTVTVHVEGRRL